MIDNGTLDAMCMVCTAEAMILIHTRNEDGSPHTMMLDFEELDALADDEVDMHGLWLVRPTPHDLQPLSMEQVAEVLEPSARCAFRCWSGVLLSLDLKRVYQAPDTVSCWPGRGQFRRRSRQAQPVRLG